MSSENSREASEAVSKGWGSKTAFILKFPFDVPARQVVEEGRKVGLHFTPQYVYVVRKNARAKERQQAGGTPSAARGRRPSTAGRDVEQEFRRLLLEIGLQRAEEILAEMRQRVDRLAF